MPPAALSESEDEYGQSVHADEALREPEPQEDAVRGPISAAKRTARADTAEALNALAKNFSTKAIADASNRLFGSDPSDGKGGGNTTKP